MGELWSDRRDFGAVSALTRHGFRSRLEMWGGGRWPGDELALSDTSAGDRVRAYLACVDTVRPAVVGSVPTSDTRAPERWIGPA